MDSSGLPSTRRGFRVQPAVSFVVACQNHAEVDHSWSALAEDRSQGHCVWLTDRFGLSWQIVAQYMADLLATPDTPTRQRLMAIKMGMRKPDIAARERAYASP